MASSSTSVPRMCLSIGRIFRIGGSMKFAGCRGRMFLSCAALVLFLRAGHAQQYDMILQGGHVVDAKNQIDGVEDIAVKDGVIARVAPHIEAKEAVKAINIAGFYVSPGLVDIHVHVYAGTGERRSYAGDNSVYPDGFTFRSGVTTVVDAGCSGWRNFGEFKQHIIDRAKTRVLVFLNIVGHGMRGSKYENDLADMEAK